MEKIKNRLSRLTLFDRVFIFLILVAISVFAYIFFRKSTYVITVIKVGEETIQYQPWNRGAGTRAWFSNMFYKGLKEEDGLGRIMAEVVDIRSFDTDPNLKDVYLKTRLRVVYNRASDQYTFKGRPVLAGSTIKLNLDELLVDGLITYVEGAKDPREKVKLFVETQLREETSTYLETSGTREYIADALSVGDEIKDDQGNIIVKILGKRVENAKRSAITSDGRIVVGTNPLRKDVYFTLDVNAIKIQNRYYLFDDVPILVGREIPLNTGAVSIWPEVTKIKEISQ